MPSRAITSRTFATIDPEVAEACGVPGSSGERLPVRLGPTTPPGGGRRPELADRYPPNTCARFGAEQAFARQPSRQPSSIVRRSA